MDLEHPTYYGEARPELKWDGRYIPAEDQTFDCVMATEFLEHYSDPEGILKEIFRVTKPDGKFFATVPFIWNLHEVPHDQYRYTPYSLERHLRNAGFKNIKVQALGGWNMAFAQMIGLWLGFSGIHRFVRPMLNLLEGFRTQSKIEVVDEFAVTIGTAANDTSAVKGKLGIPADAFVVVCGGTLEWRKGPDLLLQIASRVNRENRHIRFLWVGGKSDFTVTNYAQVQHDLKRLGLEHNVIFTGITSEPRRFLSAIDVFVLTSREDPFPLICIEAASLGKPIICFEKGGGMPEFVEDDAGFFVPYLDIETAAEKITRLYDDAQLRQQMGQAAALKA
jgi:glycosyltransferase involved in cell wall biosynthesis